MHALTHCCLLGSSISPELIVRAHPHVILSLLQFVRVARLSQLLEVSDALRLLQLLLIMRLEMLNAREVLLLTVSEVDGRIGQVFFHLLALGGWDIVDQIIFVLVRCRLYSIESKRILPQ